MIEKDIKRYSSGEIFDTEAVIKELEKESVSDIPGFEISRDHLSLKTKLSDNDMVFGLGEQIRGINKRGWIYESNCSDDPIHTEDKHSLYGAHNFIIVSGEKSYGLFVDTAGKVTFDIGYSRLDQLEISLDRDGYDIYYITGDSPEEIVHIFRSLVGRSYIPPKWAFGYSQSRWSYMDEKEIRDLVDDYHSKDIPIDCLYLDIDYMERYKDFTVNDETFPDFSAFVKEMKDKGVHLVPIIDAGVKVEDGYSVYEEGIKNGYFCKKKDDQVFNAAVWPGKAVFPDFFNKAAREWFGDKYKSLIDCGIEGFWNDMNEPAIFYSEDRLKKVFEELETYKDKNLDVDSFFAMKELVVSVANNPEDYASFYHESDKGGRVRHDLVHNLFGFNMTRAAGEAFKRIRPGKRTLMISRASYIGMHRYGGIWNGDNMSWWSHLELNIKQMPALNMCGFLYSGADLGGFSCDTTADLVARWLALGIFMPLMRNHSAAGTRRQELNAFGEKEETFRDLLSIRYMLLPYIYSEYMKAALSDGMYIKPLAFDYPDDWRARETEDQLLIGESIMIAPVYKQNTHGRMVYLPEQMKLYRMRSEKDYDVEELPAGDHYIKADLNEVLIFIRPDHIVPLAKPAKNVENLDTNDIRIMDYTLTESSYRWYDDDGESTNYDLEGNSREILIDSSGKITIEGFSGVVSRL